MSTPKTDTLVYTFNSGKHTIFAISIDQSITKYRSDMFVKHSTNISEIWGPDICSGYIYSRQNQHARWCMGTMYVCVNMFIQNNKKKKKKKQKKLLTLLIVLYRITPFVGILNFYWLVLFFFFFNIFSLLKITIEINRMTNYEISVKSDSLSNKQPHHQCLRTCPTNSAIFGWWGWDFCTDQQARLPKASHQDMAFCKCITSFIYCYYYYYFVLLSRQ